MQYGIETIDRDGERELVGYVGGPVDRAIEAAEDALGEHGWHGVVEVEVVEANSGFCVASVKE